MLAEWRKGAGKGSNLSIIQILAKANSEYNCLLLLNQWGTKNKGSELLCLQAELNTLKSQIMLTTEQQKLKNKDNKTSTRQLMKLNLAINGITAPNV